MLFVAIFFPRFLPPPPPLSFFSVHLFVVVHMSAEGQFINSFIQSLMERYCQLQKVPQRESWREIRSCKSYERKNKKQNW